jgi:hypothetical protein
MPHCATFQALRCSLHVNAERFIETIFSSEATPQTAKEADLQANLDFIQAFKTP